MLSALLWRTVVIAVSCLLISGCVSTSNDKTLVEKNNKRASLFDLANEHLDVHLKPFTSNKEERVTKLSKIYQQLLSLEPDPEVRTKVEYRLVQINTEVFENQFFGDVDDNQTLTLAQLEHDEKALQTLIDGYQNILLHHPKRSENEHIHYQLAKAFDLQGKLDASLVEIETLLIRFPNTKYLAQLNFRLGEIYYNLQDYPSALAAYNNVINATNNDKYLVNSIYMSGWSLFKLNRLPEADIAFLQVFEAILSEQKLQPNQNDFSFATLSSRYQSIIKDTQRVLSVSLSQQQQSKSLVKLVTDNKSSQFLHLYQHVLFENLAQFLIKKDLTHDAKLTYQAYIHLVKGNIWSARFSLALLDIYHLEGRFSEMYQLKNTYVEQFGLQSTFWHKSNLTIQFELLPNLLKFSDEHARRIYAHAQDQSSGDVRIKAFNSAATSFEIYLKLAKLPQAEPLLSKAIISDEYLYAEANFEAQQYKTALKSYEQIAYFSPLLGHALEQLKLKSAYATTVTIRAMIKSATTESEIKKSDKFQLLINERNRFDKLFIQQYPKDDRALQIATHTAQYSFETQDFKTLKQMSDFILNMYGIEQNKVENNKTVLTKKLSSTAFKQIQIVSQLLAHSFYQQEEYKLAESAYSLALRYADKNGSTWNEMRNLLASSIYFQGQVFSNSQPKLAVYHMLRIGKVIPESTYRITAEFDAANLLLKHQLWQQAIDVLLKIQKRYPTHEYSESIPSKLVKSYENLAQWELAAEQLLIIVAQASSNDLKREAQYTAADYYQKAGNTDKALITFRTYAHTYPEPFDVAQEVRFKMSEFYRHTKALNKQYFWFRKILKAYKNQNMKSPQVINSRAIELASSAAFGLGVAHQQTFISGKLNVPLQQSLIRKQTAMKQAIKYYQQVLDFNLAHYVPQTTFNLAEMYRQLAADVMKSERPSDLDEIALEEYDILLEELAYPFEEKAIEIHSSNAQRSWQNIYDEWVVKSFYVLAEIAPALYNKQERTHEVINAIH